MVPCCSLKLHFGCPLSFLTEVSTTLVLPTARSKCTTKLFPELLRYHRRGGWEEPVCFPAQRWDLVCLRYSWLLLFLPWLSSQRCSISSYCWPKLHLLLFKSSGFQTCRTIYSLALHALRLFPYNLSQSSFSRLNLSSFNIIQFVGHV